MGPKNAEKKGSGMATTIKDIAKRSGYSVGTVSRVLNNHPDVSDKARKKIMAVIKEKKFEPNVNAKHLKMQQKSAIALMVKGTQNLLFADLLERVQAGIHESGEEAIAAYLDEDENEVAAAMRIYRSRRPKGFVFLGGDLDFFRRDFDKIKVPSVLLTNNAEHLDFPNLSSFTTDDAGASAEVIDLLYAKGHRKIGVLGGNLSHDQISFSRIEGISRRMEAHQLEFSLEEQFEPCRFSLKEGYDAAMRLLSRRKDLTAIFALSDLIAFGAIRAIFDLGLRVPDDISVFGFDGIETARYTVPRLSTVYQNTEKLAGNGVDALLQRLHYTLPPVHEVIPFELRIEESVSEPSARKK